MTDEQLHTVIRAAVRTEPPTVTDLVAAGLARGQAMRRRRRFAAASVAAVAVTATVSVVALVAGTGEGGRPDRAEPAAPTGPCRSDVEETVLPTWARAGFSDPTPTVAHVMGARGEIVAILFGGTLHSPPSDEVNNKILWAAQTVDFGGTLTIDAVRAGTSQHVVREVPGGPGPSTIDLPAPGCWHLDLRWGDGADQRDALDLQYVRP